MTIRPIRLPGDLVTIAQVTGETWQYPENPEWSVQPDEEETLHESMNNFKRIWPLVRLIQVFSPRLRDIMHGFVWEEEDQLAGFINASRQGGTNTWYIGAVGVRPAYRRRGIARRLVQTTIDFVRERGGEKVLLDMTAGNFPAYELYRNLGFKEYSGSIEFVLTPENVPPEPSLPEGYSLEPLDFSDWKSRYDLERRITPQPLLQYEPIEESRYRRAPFSRLLRAILLSAENAQVQDFLVRSTDGKAVARAGYYARTRASGRNEITVLLDPDHPRLAGYLVKFLLHKVISKSPELNIEFSVRQWMDAVRVAAEEAGFRQRFKGLRMGLIL